MNPTVENLAMRRGMALFIDHVIIGVLSVIILLPTLMGMAETIEKPEDLVPLLLGSIYTIPAFVLIVLMVVLYEPILTYKYGWTLGKKMYNLKVVNDSGQPINMVTSMLRFLLKTICMSIPYVSIVILIFCYVRQSKGKKVFWDEWIQTSVVRN
jgi:uncharacterized RDD family membrane protein YckC